MAKLIFGCGYLGMPVARLWRDQGHTVWAVTRSPERARQFAAQGLRPVVGDLTADESLTLSPEISQELDTILFAVGYDRASLRPIYEVYVDGLARATAAAPPSLKRFIYISSTGVYGQGTGEEVDEDSPCLPAREGGRACLAAEKLLAQSQFANRAMILRLAGIYGPGRIPRAKELLAGKLIAAPAQGWLNLIHVEDAAAIVLAAEKMTFSTLAKTPQTFVVSDGHPVQRADYYRELARLLTAPPPQFGDPDVAAPATARAGSDKRVNPRRLFAELSPTLKYPSYREGLADIVANEAPTPS